jgi:hypothetical protein
MRLAGFLSLALFVGCSSTEAKPAPKETKKTEKAKPKAPAKERAMWTAPIKTLQGKDTKLDAYKGKALLLVNVASKCGLTPQYTQLEELQKKYADKGFTVIGFRRTSSVVRSPAPPRRSRRSARRRTASRSR